MYEHQAAEALSIHAWYVAAELGDAHALGAAAAAAVLAQEPLPHRRRNMALYADLPQVPCPCAVPHQVAGRLRWCLFRVHGSVRLTQVLPPLTWSGLAPVLFAEFGSVGTGRGNRRHEKRRLLRGCMQAAEARELAEARACCATAEAPPPAHVGDIFMAGGFEVRAQGAATA